MRCENQEILSNLSEFVGVQPLYGDSFFCVWFKVVTTAIWSFDTTAISLFVFVLYFVMSTNVIVFICSCEYRTVPRRYTKQPHFTNTIFHQLS